MNLRSGRGSTSAGMAHGLGEGQGESGRANEHDSGGSQEAPLLAPHPFSSPPPPPPMTHAEMMAELMAARHETASAMELMAQAIAEATRAMAGTGVVLASLRDPPLTRISSRPTCPLSH